MLLIDVLRSNVAAGRFQLQDFVIMPDHIHLLMTLQGDMSLEKAMQLIKGGFSFRLKREFGYRERSGNEGFLTCGSGMGRAFHSTAHTSFRIRSKQDLWIVPKIGPIVTATWRRKKRRG